MKLLLGAVSLAILAATATAGGSEKARASDRRALEQLATKYEQAFNRHDLKQLTALYTPDATLITATGEKASGLAEIERIARNAHEGPLKGARVDLEVESIELLSPTLALIDSKREITGGAPFLEGRGRDVVIARKSGSEWKVHSVRELPTEQVSKMGTGGSGMEEGTGGSEPQPDPMQHPEQTPRSMEDEPPHRLKR